MRNFNIKKNRLHDLGDRRIRYFYSIQYGPNSTFIYFHNSRVFTTKDNSYGNRRVYRLGIWEDKAYEHQYNCRYTSFLEADCHYNILPYLKKLYEKLLVS